MFLHKSTYRFNFFLKLTELLKSKKILSILILSLLVIFLILTSMYAGAHLYKTGKMSLIKDMIFSMPDRLRANFYYHTNDDDKLYINIGFKELKKIEYTRRKSVFNNNIGAYTSKDYVPVKINYKNNKYKAKIRLKGISDSHWSHGFRWSYRVKIKNNQTLLGMKKLTLQDYNQRGGLLEWVFMKMLDDAGLIAHRIHFIEAVINDDSLGLYSLQEQYDKLLIENNRRRVGPIVGFNKDLLFAAIASSNEDNELFKKDSFYRAPLDASYSNNSKEMMLLTQKGFQILEGFRQGTLKTSEAFDYESLAKLLSIRALLGSSELDWRDIKFYVNPITMKLEPIGREVHATFSNTDSTNWWMAKPNNQNKDEDGVDFHNLLFSDPVFYKEYLKELYSISRPSFLSDFYKKYDTELSALERKLNKYDAYSFPFKDINDRSKLIKKAVSPLKGIHVYLAKSEKDYVQLKVGNIQPFPVKIGCLMHDNTRLLCPKKNIIINGKENHSAVLYETIEMESISQKLDILKIIDDIYLNYKIVGNPNIKKSKIRNLDIQDLSIDKNLPISKNNVFGKSWIAFIQPEKRIHIIPGERVIENTLIFPKGFTVHVDPGTKLILKNNANIIFQGAVFFNGDTNRPITIESQGEDRGGMLVLSADKWSKINNTEFLGMSPVKHKGLHLSGAVTFYESNVRFQNTNFLNNFKGDDFLNIVRSNFAMENSSFSNTVSDAIDLDFSNGFVSDTTFTNIGNDALDFSGSNATLNGLVIKETNDKAISAGEKSSINIFDTDIARSKIGLASKDNSTIHASDINFHDVDYIVAAYQKKPEFGASEIFLDNYDPNIIEKDKFIVDYSSKIWFNDDIKSIQGINEHLVIGL